MTDLTNAEFVRYLYNTHLNREPCLTGYFVHTYNLDNGCTREAVVNLFLTCEEYRLVHEEPA